MNLQKNREVYQHFLRDLDSFATGSRPEDITNYSDRVWHILLNTSDFVADEHMLEGHSDYARNVSRLLYRLTQNRRARIKREIGGSYREMTSERRAFEELADTVSLLRDFVVPMRVSPANFTTALVNDVYNLSLAHVQSVVNMAIDEYFDNTETFNAKTTSTRLARRAFDTRESYDSTPGSLEGVVGIRLKLVSDSLQDIDHKKPRDFELVPTKPKEIMHKRKATGNLIKQLPLDYVPDFIVPIAQGGIELGVQLDSHYHSQGHRTVCYPVMFSIKTRRHLRPRMFADRLFLEQAQDKSHLVTEDWITTGRTLIGVVGDLTARQPQDVRVATIKRDPSSLDHPILGKYEIYAGEISKYTGPKTDQTR